MENGSVDSLVFGQRLRHLRRSRDLTLDQLRELVGKQASFLSLIDNGKREARLSLIRDLPPGIPVRAAQALRSAGYEGGAVAESTLTSIVAHYGFTLHRVQDLPVSVDSVADLEHRRIYVHQRNTMPTRAARSVVLQTLGHFALGHGDPKDFGEFLRQRVEANYFSGAVLAPQRTAVELLTAARRKGDISAEDLKEVFYISYEMAAHRLTNLATHHLGLGVHFL